MLEKDGKTIELFLLLKKSVSPLVRKKLRHTCYHTCVFITQDLYQVKSFSIVYK